MTRRCSEALKTSQPNVHSTKRVAKLFLAFAVFLVIGAVLDEALFVNSPSSVNDEDCEVNAVGPKQQRDKQVGRQ